MFMLLFDFVGKIVDSNCARVNHCCDLNLLFRKYFGFRCKFRLVVQLLGHIIYVETSKCFKIRFLVVYSVGPCWSSG